MSTPFRQDRSPVEKPGPGSRTCRAGGPASAKRGVVFSWVLLFWTSKREVPRPPKEDESSSALMPERRRSGAIPAFAGMTTEGGDYLHAHVAQGVANHSVLGRIVLTAPNPSTTEKSPDTPSAACPACPSRRAPAAPANADADDRPADARRSVPTARSRLRRSGDRASLRADASPRFP